MNRRTIPNQFLKAIACLSVTALAHSAGASENLLLDGSISSAQGAASYTFNQGYPTGTTAADVYRNSLTRRAIEAYKTFLPTITTEAMFDALENVGAVPNKVGVTLDQGPRHQIAYTNSDTPYSFAIVDLREGPMVIDMPPNPLLLGLVDDHNMRWITNLGGIGPEKGKGGRHLILPPGYDGEVPTEGYFVSQSLTWKILPGIRSVPLKISAEEAIDAAREIKIYPFGQDRETANWSWIDATETRMPLPLLEWEGRLGYWEELHDVIQYEAPQDEDRYAMGALQQLGITKGAPFSPDEETLNILTGAALAAHSELAITGYANRDPARLMWDDRRWELLPLATMHLPKGDFGDEGLIGREASDQYFFLAWGTGSTIGVRKPGSGSVYFSAFADEGGTYLDGAKSYKMTIPGPVPAELFWSVTVYDSETRVLIETPLNRAAVRSHRDDPQANKDDSFDIYFGPEVPEGPESNWVQTIPGRGWFTAVRIYSPTEVAFDGTWRLGDIMVIK